MSKHTKGPWEQRTFAIYAGKELIAHTGGTLGAGPKTMEQEANARLIAAATDLLEACKAMLSSPTYGNEPSDEAVEMTIAAIAKAEGQS